jgi:DNA-binding NarL/FixJ family response regulator
MAERPSPPTLGSPIGLVVDSFEEGGQTYAVLEWPAPPTTTPRVPRAQRAVLLKGLSNAEIALRLGRSIHTVAHQVDTIFRHLGVGSRLELFALVARLSRGQEEP